jgi:hypothetical protein
MKMKLFLFAMLGMVACGVGDALEDAEDYARKHIPDATGVECIQGACASSDDNYVSCTVDTPKGPVPIECRRNTFGGGSGCRMATGRGAGRSR